MGAKEEDIFLGTLNAGHPGGMFPLTEAEKDSLHSARLPENLYIADATLIPKAMGNPPILTIMALAMKISEKNQSSLKRQIRLPPKENRKLYKELPRIFSKKIRGSFSYTEYLSFVPFPVRKRGFTGRPSSCGHLYGCRSSVFRLTQSIP